MAPTPRKAANIPIQRESKLVEKISI